VNTKHISVALNYSIEFEPESYESRTHRAVNHVWLHVEPAEHADLCADAAYLAVNALDCVSFASLPVNQGDPIYPEKKVAEGALLIVWTPGASSDAREQISLAIRGAIGQAMQGLLS